MATRKEDIRITKTKSALSNAFFTMLKTTPIDDLTINDLCEQADVRRATFYKHFKDKNDFMVFLIKDIRAQFDEKTWHDDLDTNITKEYYMQYAEAVIDYLLERDTAIKKLINSPIRSTFFDVFLHENYEDTRKRLEVTVENGAPLFAPVDTVASMIVGGVAHCIIKWFDSDNRRPKDELLEDIYNFISKVLD